MQKTVCEGEFILPSENALRVLFEAIYEVISRVDSSDDLKKSV